MAQKPEKISMDPVEKLKAAGFSVESASDFPGWTQASRGGCAILFRKTADRQIERFRSAGVVLQGKIFRVLDRGFQKFLSDDQREIPATAGALQ